MRDDVMAAETIGRRHGMEMMVRDQTRPDLPLPTVKVLVPGLRPVAARFGPGRLYDAPVAQGRLVTATRYEDVNPIPLPL
nr:YcaO-like family protein [Actinoplanes teichomyceticus]